MSGIFLVLVVHLVLMIIIIIFLFISPCIIIYWAGIASSGTGSARASLALLFQIIIEGKKEDVMIIYYYFLDDF